MELNDNNCPSIISSIAGSEPTIRNFVLCDSSIHDIEMEGQQVQRILRVQHSYLDKNGCNGIDEVYLSQQRQKQFVINEDKQRNDKIKDKIIIEQYDYQRNYTIARQNCHGENPDHLPHNKSDDLDEMEISRFSAPNDYISKNVWSNDKTELNKKIGTQAETMIVNKTPPAKTFKVWNPFETGLTERLRMPLINSPSLFQFPSTPQLSSTKFEWTIDQISGMRPAEVEPDVTQFEVSPDPDLEAKAQKAISHFFKEHQIVPSPVDCSLRNNRIILEELNGSTPVTKPSRHIRDWASQTDLSLPVVLPTNLEEALKPFFQSNCTPSTPESNKIQRSDISLRRKLFDMQNIILLEKEETSPKMRSANGQCNTIAGKLSDSLDSSSTCSLSPMSGCTSLSPDSNAVKRKFSLMDFPNDEPLSPICRETHRMVHQIQTPQRRIYRKHLSTINAATQSYETGLIIGSFTPERSSSPVNKNLAELSLTNFKVRTNHLNINSVKNGKDTTMPITSHIDYVTHNDMYISSDTIEENSMCSEYLQISDVNLNTNTSTCEKASLKLSSSNRSFYKDYWLHDWNENKENKQTNATAIRTQSTMLSNELTIGNSVKMNRYSDTFGRTDSGFNELTAPYMSASSEANIMTNYNSTLPKVKDKLTM